ncbi:MAG: transcriptional regulator, MarR/EmrR family protein [Clostridia bacterium]|nr:transcriptional regulator, MarR/EmrR family protein [Clostridia bacterium]
MIEHSNELIEELIETFRNFKKIKLKQVSNCGEFTHNEKMILFILKDISKDSRVSLSTLRGRMKLAPSTITPIITLLEEKGLIERNIDKTDRRNIFLQISPKGEEFTEKIQIEIKNEMSKYIEYIGEDDTKQLIRLISKTTDFFERKGR